MHQAWTAGVCAVVALGIPIGVAAQQTEAAGRVPGTPFPVPRTAETPTLDGSVIEELWRSALLLELRYEVRPGENIEPPVRTEMLLTYDDDSLYVAFRCHDPNPAAIRARFSDRDAMMNDDFVGIVLDTFNDERRAFEFFSNPLGVQGDMFMDDVSGNEDANWNAIWYSAGRITATGYEVELRIPMNQLRFEATSGPQTWGIDGIRSYPRRDRHHITLFPRIRGENSYLGQEEKISGFSGISAVQNPEVIPTVTAVRADSRRDPAEPLTNVRSDGDFGLTMTWGVTPNVTFNGTINPDFSQIEADAVQLDVNNQFALFFAETRPFFLEGSDLFRTSRMNLLHTRQVAQPDGALKLSGKNGRHAFGVFSARDETTTVIVPGSQRSQTRLLDADTTATVGRYRFDIGSNSTIGTMVTDRRGAGYFNNVVAFDTRHRITTADSINATVAVSRTQDQPAGGNTPARSDTAVDVSYNHGVRNWNVYAVYSDLGGDFRADIGFINQVDVRRWETGGGWTWHGEDADFYDRINISSNIDETKDQQGSLIEREWEGYISFNGPRESFALWGGGVRRQVWNGIVFDQRFQSAIAELRPSGFLQLGTRASWGDWVDFVHIRPAKQRTGRTFVNLNPGRYVSVRITHIYELLNVTGGRLFSAHVPELRLIYQRDLRTLVRVILQDTDVSRERALYAAPVAGQNRDLFAQLLYSYKVNPQTALYVGYVTGSRAAEQHALYQANRTLFAKVSYAWVK